MKTIRMEEITQCATLETITPMHAEDFLRRNSINRKVMPSRVKFYADLMAQNRWMVNGETIQFDINGNLLNGQHRLKACILSGCSFQTYVVRGLPCDVMHTLDTGKHRTAGDALQILGSVNTTTLAAAITWILRYKNGTAARTTYSHGEIIEFWGKNKIVEESVSIGRSQQIMAPGIASGFHFLFCEFDREAANQFMEDLASGTNLGPNDPAHVLRETLIKNKTQKIKFQAVEVAAKLVRAWNFRRTGNTVKSLQGTTLLDGRRTFPTIQ